jgi:quinol-cytochrome oxidoreductase complex cytochrome b subunit
VDFVKGIFNTLADPRLFFIGACVLLWLMIWKRELMASNAIGYGMQGFLAVFFIFGAFDPNFRLIMTKPDNVPIVGLIFILIFLTWYSMREVLSDRRIAAGRDPSRRPSRTSWVWPDLVYTELISLILCSVVLILWSVFLKAPLEQPANRSVTPNPSKAPWYFLGLQEMLVYFDPWLAGVVLPGLIIAGLIAIPYVDKNPKGNGYYTFNERKIEITLFLFGFVILWVSLIVLGTFLRGRTGTSSARSSTGTRTSSRRSSTSTCPSTSGCVDLGGRCPVTGSFGRSSGYCLRCSTCSRSRSCWRRPCSSPT